MDEVQQAYARRASEYVELFGSTDHVAVEDLDLIGRHLSIGRGAVLDVGCGPGHLTAHLRSSGVWAIGIDLVSEFVTHARVTYPDVPYLLGSIGHLPVPDGSVTGVLAWYSTIHVRPEDLDGVLVELRRVMVPGGRLVLGFFDGAAVAPFDHAVTTAHYWPIDELSDRLARAGFTEVERRRRPGIDEAGRRPHGAIAAAAG